MSNPHHNKDKPRAFGPQHRSSKTKECRMTGQTLSTTSTTATREGGSGPGRATPLHNCASWTVLVLRYRVRKGAVPLALVTWIVVRTGRSGKHATGFRVTLGRFVHPTRHSNSRTTAAWSWPTSQNGSDNIFSARMLPEQHFATHKNTATFSITKKNGMPNGFLSLLSVALSAPFSGGTGHMFFLLPVLSPWLAFPSPLMCKKRTQTRRPEKTALARERESERVRARERERVRVRVRVRQREREKKGERKRKREEERERERQERKE